MYDISNPAHPLRLVQGYLLEISYAEEGLPHLSIDGVAGEETTAAIRLFQRQNGLPPTGKTDLETWEAIFRHYEYAKLLRTADPTLVPRDALPLTPRAVSSEVYLLQTMLNAMRPKYATLPLLVQNGSYDLATENAVRLYQGHRLLPASGIADLATWEALAEEYGRRPRAERS